MVKNVGKILLLYCFLGMMMLVLDLVFTYENHMSFNLTIVELINIIIILVLYLFVAIKDITLAIFQKIACYGTVCFLLAFFSFIVRALVILKKSLLFLMIFVIPIVAIVWLGYMGYRNAKKNANLSGKKKMVGKTTLVGTGVCLPIVAFFDTWKKQFIRTESQEVIMVMVVMLLVVCVLVYVYTTIALNIKDRISEERGASNKE